MITITVTIQSTDGGITLRQSGSNSPKGATDDECRAADIISQAIHQGMEDVRQEGDIRNEIVPYTRMKRSKPI